jgi:hypothetical protein
MNHTQYDNSGTRNWLFANNAAAATAAAIAALIIQQ